MREGEARRAAGSHGLHLKAKGKDTGWKTRRLAVQKKVANPGNHWPLKGQLPRLRPAARLWDLPRRAKRRKQLVEVNREAPNNTPFRSPDPGRAHCFRPSQGSGEQSTVYRESFSPKDRLLGVTSSRVTKRAASSMRSRKDP